jgi:hypothetical protein
VERLAAIEFAKDALGAEVNADPLEAMTQAVRLSCGLTAYYRQRLARMETHTREDEQLFESALQTQAKIAKAALDAGLEARVVALAERQAEPLILAIEEGFAALSEANLGLSNEQRTIFAAALSVGLRRFEEPSIDATVVELPVTVDGRHG